MSESTTLTDTQNNPRHQTLCPGTFCVGDRELDCKVLDISLGYRYIATTDGDIYSRTTSPLPENDGSRRIEAEYDAHEVVLGLRFNF